MENKKEKVPELLVLPVVLVNDLLAYLGTKPFTEVEPYINAIKRDAKLVDSISPVLKDEIAVKSDEPQA